jgi:hypothetical protein
MVVINDVMAYMFGFFLGRTPLVVSFFLINVSFFQV